MPVKSTAVGLTTEPHDYVMTERQLLAYAAGIGDTNARYFDDAAAEGIVAHPAFCVALEWPVALALREHPRFQLAREERIRGVHAAQDSIFHRPIRPGDRLRTTGTVVQIRAIKPGAFVVTKFATVDATTGDPVVTSYSCGILRGVAVQGEDAQIEEAPSFPRPREEHDMDQEVAISISRQAPHVYTECARIWNPIHTERAVALEAGLPDIILHGTATWAMAVTELVNRCAGGDPTRLQRFSGRFTAMVIPGTTITLQYHASDNADVVSYTVRNADGAPAIAQGLALMRVSA